MSDVFQLQSDLTKLVSAITAYKSEARKDWNEVLMKQGGKLAWNIASGLKKLAPGKGMIRAERLAALKSKTSGVIVRDSVKQDIAAKYGATYSLSLEKTFLAQHGGKRGRGKKIISYGTTVVKDGKTLNLQALMVERELALRESARGFSGYAVPKPERSYIAEAAFSSDVVQEIESRYNFILSTYGLSLATDDKSVELKWLGAMNSDYHDALAGLSKEKQIAVLRSAVQETTADIITYINRKNAERAAKLGLN